MASRIKNISYNLSERLRLLRNKNNMTQKELGQKLFKSESTVRMWELGKSEPDIETINKLSEIFSVPVDYLVGRDTSTPNEEKPLRKQGVRIPVYGEVAAGVPILAIENYNSDDPDDWEEITEEMARGGEYIALRIHGDSMEPKISNGDIVIVRLQPDVESGETAIVRVNGDNATCKKIKKTPDGILLISTNPAYEPMFYSRREIMELPIAIIGKVVELRAKF